MAESVTANLGDFLKGIATEAWDMFMKDPVLYIVASVITMVVGSITLGLLMGPLMLGLIQIVQRRRRGETASPGDVFGGLSKIVPALLMTLLIGIAASIGFFLLVIPGMLVMLFVGFAFHEMAYRNTDIMGSIKGSFALVKANLVPIIVLMVCIGVVNSIGGIIVIGSLVTFPLSILATTIAYEKLSNQLPQQAQQPVSRSAAS